MMGWQEKTLSYFYSLVALVVTAVVLLIVIDSFKYRQIRNSLNAYMNNLSDMIFMSTYDSLKKGNMKLFKGHLEEVGTFGDVYEFSLIDKLGIVRYSSNPELVKKTDQEVFGLEHKKKLLQNDRSTLYFPVKTTTYCSRCHPTWKVGSVNSYYKLTLSSEALNAARQSTVYFHGFTVVGGIVFLAFMFMLFSRYERRKHEEQLHLSASVFEYAVEAMVITSFEGIIERVNSAFTKITGFDVDDVIGRHISHIDAGDVNESARKGMRESLSAKGLWSGELWNLRKNGTSIPIHLSVTAVRNAKNRTTHYVSVFHDASDYKKMMEEQKRSAQLAALGTVAAGVAHEINNPIQGILNYATLINSKPEKTDYVQEISRRIIKESERIATITKDMLYYSKDNTTILELADIRQTIEKSLSLIDTKVRRRGILIEKHFAKNLPKIPIQYQSIQQVIINLVDNAYDALRVKEIPNEEKVINVSAYCLDHENEPYVCIEVTDNGVGMSKSALLRAKDAFFSTKPSTEGTGLGLSIVADIVANHLGELEIESVEGEHTKVKILLPQQGNCELF